MQTTAHAPQPQQPGSALSTGFMLLQQQDAACGMRDTQVSGREARCHNRACWCPVMHQSHLRFTCLQSLHPWPRPAPVPQWKGHPQQLPQPRQSLHWPLPQAGFSSVGSDGSLPLFSSMALPAAPPLHLPPSRCSSRAGSSMQIRSASQPASCGAGVAHLGSHPLDLDSQGFAQLRQHSMPAAAAPGVELEHAPHEQQQRQLWQQRQHSLPAMWLPPPAPQRHDDWNNTALGLPVTMNLSLRRESSGTMPSAASSFDPRQLMPSCLQTNPAWLAQQEQQQQEQQQWWQRQQQDQQLHRHQQQLQHQHPSMQSEERCTPTGASLPELGLPPPLVSPNAAVWHYSTPMFQTSTF